MLTATTLYYFTRVAGVRFQNKVVVLTGVGRQGQVGEAIGRAFGSEGARVVAVARLESEVEARAAELRAAGFDARGFACDLADETQLRVLSSEVQTAYDGRVDALVNIAGGFAMSGPVAESDFAVWQRQFAINLTTAYLTTRAFLPLLRAARGAIVYFSSAAALPGAKVGRMSAYAAAKAGVLTLMRAVAEEERGNGVRANALAPTAIRTAANLESMGEGVRYVEREQVASAVLWLCSEEASGVTGQVVQLG
jgi:NAD(P)-dependent dehydrogenase (short-subunit alcohol dehydrogenase family)